jgi:hypothetical protein
MCRQEMHDRVGCTLEVFSDFADDEPRPRVRFGDETRMELGRQEHCPDCLAPRNTFHHPGCDIEQCPRCGGQALTCGCAVEFRPSDEALRAALDAYDGPAGTLVFTDIWALGEYPVTSVFHFRAGDDLLGWWLFAEERHVSAEILRVAPMHELAGRDPRLAAMLELPEGSKAFRDGDSDDWLISDI